VDLLLPVQLIHVKENDMACSSCGKARVQASGNSQGRRNLNQGTQPTGIKTVDSQSIKGSPTGPVASSPNRTASTRTKV